MRSPSLMLAALAAVAVPSTLSAADGPATLGKPIANISLKDYHGQTHSLDSLAPGKPLVLAFLGTECPLAKLYSPRLAELAKRYADQGVVFVGVDANRQDAVTEIAAYARTHEIKFPILKDLGQQLADRVGVTRTPEVVMLDAAHAIRYRGRIDDQYGFQVNVSYQKPKPTENNLSDAIDALLAGKPVVKPEIAAVGCLIGRDGKPQADSDVTYTKQIARIMNANCVFCHREGQIAPFTLTSYEETAGWAAMIDEVVQSERMPPWHANEKFGHFKNDARLSSQDKETIKRWVAAGAPQGDPKDLPAPPQFTTGWMIPQPDEIVHMKPEAYKVPATGVVEYQMFVVDPGWKEDKWISAVEPRPGNPSVVHHILMFVLPPDGNLSQGLGSGNDFLAAYAPGLRPEPLDPGLARYVPAGSKLIFQMHYTPNGSPQTDRSYCGFVFADPKTVRKEVRVNSALNAVFEIPPDNDSFNVKARYIFRDDSLLLTLMPHMHLRGKAFRYEATYPDGSHEVLLDVPRYDFGWQTNYRFTEPKRMPRGTRMDCFAVFDNSEDNLNNPNSKVPVRFGDQTFEEMMIGFFESTPIHEDRQDPAKAAKPLSRLDQFNVIMAATRGEPDDNVQVGAYMAMADPNIFRQFAMILRTMVPQVDRVCVTTIKDGKIVELMGPASRGPVAKDSAHQHDHDENDAEVEKAILEARKKAGKTGPPAANLFSPLPKLDAQGEPLAEYIAGGKVVANDDLSKVPGKLMETMHKRGARSSLHVPAEISGTKVCVSFWSSDPDAFNPAAQAFLGGVAKIMTAPKENAQAQK